MKLFGFCGGDDSKIIDQLTLEVDASELRELANFFLRCAEEMEEDEDWSHEHFSDYLGKVLEQELVVSKFYLKRL